MSFGDLKFGTRLAITFGVLMLLVAALVGVGVSNVNQLRREVQQAQATQPRDEARLQAAADAAGNTPLLMYGLGAAALVFSAGAAVTLTRHVVD